MSSNGKKIIRNTVAVNIGCSCRRPKLSDIYQPKPKTQISSSRKSNLILSSLNSSWETPNFSVENEDEDEDDTTTTFSPNNDTPPNLSEAQLKSSKMIGDFARIGDSVAVVKISDDPYLDFRLSMLQMICEKEIYAQEDLRQLLYCFLHLNSPCHHEIIVRAFTEIWNGVFSVKPGSGSGSSSMKPRVRSKSPEF